MIPNIPVGIIDGEPGVLGVAGTAQAGRTAPSGRILYVSPDGNDDNTGLDPLAPLETLAQAITLAEAGDTIYLAPGEYAEAVTISRSDAHANLTIVGAGGRGAAYIAAPTNGTALTNHADDLTLINVGLEGDGTGGGLVNTGSRLRAYGCKLEGGALALSLTLGTVAQEAAGTRGVGADVLFEDCEFAWATRGVKFTCTDYGALTQQFFSRCRFHNLSTAHFAEAVGSGGAAGVMYRNVQIADCLFDNDEGGAAPTNFLLLDGDNANDGIVTRCSFPTALNGGLSLVSTNLIWVCNYHTAGVSNAQPS